MTIPTKYVNVVYLDTNRNWVILPLSEANETIYWTQQSAETSQLVCEYAHEYYTVQKVVTSKTTAPRSTSTGNWKQPKICNCSTKD
jgi:hypothetical protein